MTSMSDQFCQYKNKISLKRKSVKNIIFAILIKFHGDYDFASCDYVYEEVKYGHLGTKRNYVSPSVRPPAAFN